MQLALRCNAAILVLVLILVCDIRNVETKIGDISLQKCKEYSRIKYDIPTKRIIGGTPVQESEFPHMAALFYNEPFFYFGCGGSLISENFVLTAAHCMFDIGPPFMARLGTIDIIEPGPLHKDYAVSEPIVHPDFYTTNRSIFSNADVALLRLNESVSFTRTIKPICLETHSLFDSSKTIAIGWGCTENAVISPTLLKVSLALSGNFCKKWFEVDVQDGTYLCTGGDKNEGKTTCEGDSGGPLQIIKRNRYYLVGILSAANTKDYTATATKVSTYIGWIEENVWIKMV